jgi:hypothetical protein
MENGSVTPAPGMVHFPKFFQKYSHLCLYRLLNQRACRASKSPFNAQTELSHLTRYYGILFHGVLLMLLT